MTRRIFSVSDCVPNGDARFHVSIQRGEPDRLDKGLKHESKEVERVDEGGGEKKKHGPLLSSALCRNANCMIA